VRRVIEAPRGVLRPMIRDRDCIYGAVVRRRMRAMGIRDKPIAPASPWQNGFVERLIGSIRRECVDHIIVLGEAHLRRILKSYARHYMRRGRTLPWIRMRPSLAQFSKPVWSDHSPPWADFITTTAGFRFSVQTGVSTNRFTAMALMPRCRAHLATVF
jgi:transposase InsO family protein